MNQKVVNRHVSEHAQGQRILSRTESSAFRQANRTYHLANNIYSKQNTYNTVASTGSQNYEYRSRNKIRSTNSSKSLFSNVGNPKQKLRSHSQIQFQTQMQAKGLKSYHNNFVTPTKSALNLANVNSALKLATNSIVKDISYMSKQPENVKMALQQILIQKINNKKQIKIKQEIQGQKAVKRLIDQTHKNSVSQFLQNQSIANFSFQNKQANNVNNSSLVKNNGKILQTCRQNLQKSFDAQKFKNLVSQYAQTQPQTVKKQPVKKLSKVQTFSLQIHSINTPLTNKTSNEIKLKLQRQSNTHFEKNEKKKQTSDFKKIKDQNIQQSKPSKIKNDIASSQQNSQKFDDLLSLSTPKQDQSSIRNTNCQQKQIQLIKNKSIQSKVQFPISIKQQAKNKIPLKTQQYDYIDFNQIQSINLAAPTLNKVSNDKKQEKQQQQSLKNDIKYAQTENKEPSKVQNMVKKETQMQKAQKKESKQTTKQNQEKENKKKLTLHKQKQRKKTAQQFNEAIKIIDIMTPVGEVAGYCAQLLKKSKLNWHTPAILLYKECYQTFKKYEEIHLKAASLGVIDQQQSDKFIEDNTILTKNLQKIVAMGKKKNKLSNQNQKLATLDEFVALQKHIQREVIEYAKSVLESEQKSNFDAMLCLLRMINSVKIIALTKGHNTKPLDDLQKIPPQKIQNVVKKNLQDILIKNLKL